MKESLFNKVCKVWFLVILSLVMIGAASQGGKIIQGIVTLSNYVSATAANRVDIIDDLSSRYTYNKIVDVTNGTDAGGTSCPAGTGYCYYIDLASYRSGSFQIILSCTALTVTAKAYGTIQDDCAPSACTYKDITLATFGAASLVATAGSADDIWGDNVNKLSAYKYVYIEIVAATGGNTGDWRIDEKRVW